LVFFPDFLISHRLIYIEYNQAGLELHFLICFVYFPISNRFMFVENFSWFLTNLENSKNKKLINSFTATLLWKISHSGYSKFRTRIGGVMVSLLASSAVDRRFEPRSGQTKDYKIGICCFSAKHAALRRNNKNWLARNQNNVSEWSNMSTRGLLFQWARTIQIQLSVVV
jgi:hypothetical protein